MNYFSYLTKILLSVFLLTSSLSAGLVLCVEKDGTSEIEIATSSGRCSSCPDHKVDSVRHAAVHIDESDCTDVPLADTSTYISSKQHSDSLETFKQPLIFFTFAFISEALPRTQSIDLPRTLEERIPSSDLLAKRSTVLLI